jgi:membrane-associated phospholipid phosphatase
LGSSCLAAAPGRGISMRLRLSEWIAIAYFVYLAAAAVVRGTGRGRRRVVATAAAVVSAVLTIPQFGTLTIARDWMPLAYVVLAYRLPALLVATTNAGFERTLLTLDHRWLGVQSATIRGRVPRPVIEALELAYLFCYPMVPIGFGCLYAAGLREEADRFWTAVLLAVFGCYGVLPWLPTRPPRAIEGEPIPSSGVIRRLNLHVLGRASIQLNTFPSGHAAASLATALAVGARLPAVGLVLGVLAAGIAVGSVIGRYHYAADALAGALLGLVGFMISRFV